MCVFLIFLTINFILRSKIWPGKLWRPKLQRWPACVHYPWKSWWPCWGGMDILFLPSEFCALLLKLWLWWDVSYFIHLCFSLQDNLSAIDILSACNLVNYFGKMDLGGSGVGQISVYPVLLKKVHRFSSRQCLTFYMLILCFPIVFSGHDFCCDIWSWQH